MIKPTAPKKIPLSDIKDLANEYSSESSNMSSPSRLREKLYMQDVSVC